MDNECCDECLELIENCICVEFDDFCPDCLEDICVCDLSDDDDD